MIKGLAHDFNTQIYRMQKARETAMKIGNYFANIGICPMRPDTAELLLRLETTVCKYFVGIQRFPM